MRPFTMFTLPSARWLLCFFSLLRMLEDGDATFSCQPTNLLDLEGVMAGSLSHFQGDCSAVQAIQPVRDTACAIQGVDITLSWYCHRQGEPYFASAPMRIGLLPWSAILLSSASGDHELVSIGASRLFAVRSLKLVARCG